MRIPLFQVDAFASAVFRGNPAAVCPLDSWLPDELMQAIASENNLSETAFFVPEGEDYRLRWFTPEAEVDLCGHATLASAAVVFERLQPELRNITFQSRSGPLKVTRDGAVLTLDFPSRPGHPGPVTEALVAALGSRPREVFNSRDVMAVFDSEAEVRALRPSFDRLKALGVFGVIVTAPGEHDDFVSRYFAPEVGVFEDPVTGSAHCTLIPYWSRRLGRVRLRAKQLSARGGELSCEARGERVLIGGRAAFFLEGTITVD